MQQDRLFPGDRPAPAITVTQPIVWSWLNRACFTLLVVTLPFAQHAVLISRPRPRVYYEFTSFNLYLSDLAVVATLAVWWFSLRGKAQAVRWGPGSIVLPLAGLTGIGFLSALWAPDSALALYTSARLGLLLALYLWTVNRTPASRWVDRAIAASLILESIVALLQFIRQGDLGLQWLGEIRLDPPAAGLSVIAIGEQVWLRGYGLTPHPNILGGVLAVFILALIPGYLHGSGHRRLVWLVVLGLGSAGLAISFSRAAWLGLAVGGAGVLAGVLSHAPWRQRYRWALLIPAGLSLLVVLVVVIWRFDLFAARLRPGTSAAEQRSLDERLVLTQIALETIRRHPLTGIGAGNFSTVSATFIGDNPAYLPQPVHNVPLLVTAELGPLGGVLWGWLTLAPAVLTWRAYRKRRASLRLVALAAGLLVLATVNLFDFYTWGWPQGRLLQWTFLGLWSATFEARVG